MAMDSFQALLAMGGSGQGRSTPNQPYPKSALPQTSFTTEFHVFDQRSPRPIRLEPIWWGMASPAAPRTPNGGRPLLRQLRVWQDARQWARLIREAETLWHIDVRDLHRLAALELGQLIGEVPARLRQRVNRWLARYRVSTRLMTRPPADRNDGSRLDG